MRLHLVGAVLLAMSCRAAEADSLWPIQQQLAGKKFVDLTHEFAPGIPHWAGFPEETRQTVYWYDKRRDTKGAGFFVEVFTHVGQSGTHVDPPAHFIKGLRTVDQINPREMFSALVVVAVCDNEERLLTRGLILSTNHYQIELLTNLDQVPESGAIVVVSFPKPKGGSGFPARVFAIVP